MADLEYSPEQRSRNRLSVVLGTAVFLGIVLISGTLQGWSGASIAGVFVIVLAAAALVWSLFASHSARPLPTDRKHVISEAEWDPSSIHRPKH